MPRKAGMLVVLVLLSALAACAPSQREILMERDLAEMKRRLAEVEQRQASARKEVDTVLQDRLEGLSRRLADQQANQDSLRVELQSSRGRLDDLQQQVKEGRDAGRLGQEDLGLRVSKLEASLDELSKKPAAQPPVSSQSLYERGRDLIQKQDYANGRSALEEFLKTSPQDELAPNARYWIGESYYGEKKYQDAILEFQEVMDRFGEHPKAASSMYKQGLAFQALGDLKNARVVMRKLVENYPRAEESKRAKDRLSEWDSQEKKETKTKKK